MKYRIQAYKNDDLLFEGSKWRTVSQAHLPALLIVPSSWPCRLQKRKFGVYWTTVATFEDGKLVLGTDETLSK